MGKMFIIALIAAAAVFIATAERRPRKDFWSKVDKAEVIV